MKLEKRQKVILGLVIVAVIILIWQLYVIFGGGSSPGSSSSSSSDTKTVTVSTLKEVSSPTNVMQPAAGSVSVQTNMTPTQQKYLALVSQYQLVEIQRLIAQDQAAIAAARAATAESLSKINESGGDVSSLMTNIVSDNQAGDYELIYTGQDNGEWTATLKRNGQFNDVTTGTTLSNGDKVLSVSDSGVVVQEGNTKKLVTFNGVSQVSNQAAAAPAPAASLESQLQTPSISKSSKSKTVTTSEVKTETKVAALPSPVADVQAPKKSVVLPKVVATTVKPENSKTTGFDITKADKSSYTIQVISGDNLEAVKSFIADNNLTDKAQVVKIQRNHKPWYIGVIGEYPSSAAAQKSIDQLPDSVQDEGPFVRRIENVQSSMVK